MPLTRRQYANASNPSAAATTEIGMKLRGDGCGV